MNNSDEYKLYQRIVDLVAASNAKVKAALQEKIDRLSAENRRLSRSQTTVSRNNFFR